jgi:hypothetical protein
MHYKYDQLTEALAMAHSATQGLEEGLSSRQEGDITISYDKLLDLCWVLKGSLHTLQTAYPTADSLPHPIPSC